MTLSREAAEHKKTFLPQEVIQQTARLCQPILERRGTALSLDLPSDLPAVYGSPGELTQVMFNLLSNAGRHTEGGRICVSAEETGGSICVRVSDNGSGISPEFLPHAFERCAHDDPGGTGLGLFICKEIIEGFGGTIRIESRPGKGTEVIFTLPVCEEEMNHE